MKKLFIFILLIAGAAGNSFAQYTGVLGPPTNGTQAVGDGTKFKSQAKPFTDARDFYDCSYATDSSTALNAATNNQSPFNGTKTVFPFGCHVKLNSGWTIQNQAAFLLQGYSSPGPLGVPALNSPTLSYCGTSGGTVLNFQRVNGPTVENLVVDGWGTGCANGAGSGLVFDETGGGGNSTFFGVIRNVQVNAGLSGSHNTAFVGMNFSPAQANDVQHFLIDSSYINCTSSGPATTDTTVGIKFNSLNTKQEHIQYTNVDNCATAINTGQGGFRIEGGRFSNNKADLVFSGNSDPTVIDAVTSVASGQAITSPIIAGGTPPVMISNSHFAPASAATPNTATVSLGDTANATPFTLMNNNWDDPSTYCGVTGAFPLASNLTNSLVMINNNLFGTGSICAGHDIPSGLSNFILPEAHNFGQTYAWLYGGRMRMGANYTQGGNADIGYGFFTSIGADGPGVYYNNDQQLGTLPGEISTALVPRDSMYLGDANIVVSGMWPIDRQGIRCTVTGTTGTVWVIEVFALDAAGKRSGNVNSTGNPAQCSGRATFDGSDFLTITWPATPNASTYDVVLLNPANHTQGWLAVNTSSQTATVNSGPGAFSYVFPSFAESAQTTINGESLTVNAPTTFKVPVLFSLDNTNSIGTLGANRPSTGYFGTSVVAPLVNATTGIEVGGTAPTGHCLIGNGTMYVDATCPGGSGGTVTNAASLTANFPVVGAGLNAVATLSTTFTSLTTTCAGPQTWALGSAWIANATMTITGACTLNLTGPLNGGSYVLRVTQGTGGSHTLALGTGCTWVVSNAGAGAVTPTTTAGAVDVLAFVYDGSHCNATYSRNFN